MRKQHSWHLDPGRLAPESPPQPLHHLAPLLLGMEPLVNRSCPSDNQSPAGGSEHLSTDTAPSQVPKLKKQDMLLSAAGGHVPALSEAPRLVWVSRSLAGRYWRERPSRCLQASWTGLRCRHRPTSQLTALQTGASGMDTACFPRREAQSSSSVYPTVCWDPPSPEGAQILQTEPRAR